MANFTIGLDLQGLVKKVYKTLQYESSFYKMLNDNYIGEVRNTGTPVIEILNSDNLTINVRQTEEIANALVPTLATALFFWSIASAIAFSTPDPITNTGTLTE